MLVVLALLSVLALLALLLCRLLFRLVCFAFVVALLILLDPVDV